MHKSRRYLGFDDNQLREAVDVALTLVAGEGLTPLADGGYFALPELPPSWVTTTDHLRKPRTRDTPLWQWRQEPLPAVSFTPEQAVGSERVHLHLAHPVVHRLLSRFLAQGHAAHDLSRATVLGAPAGDRTRVLAFGRLSLFGAGATRLHDRIIAVAAYWNLAGGDDHLRPFAPGSGDEREAQLHLDAALLTAKAVSEAMYRPMLERAAADFRALWSAIEEEAAAEEQRARLQLADRGRVEAGELRTILEQHRAELNRELAGQTQELFPDEPLSKKQRQQREAYRQYMDERRRSIEADLQTEPAELARSYDVVTRRLEPLGVVYLVRSAS